MQPREKISKSSWTMLQGVKDATLANMTNAIHGGQLKVEAKVVTALLAVIGASIDEGYHRSHKTFMKEVDAAIADAVSTEAMPSLKGTSPPKKR